MNKRLYLGVIVMITLETTITTGISQTYAWIDPNTDPVKKAPTAIADVNVYVV